MTNTERHRIQIELYDALLGSLDLHCVFQDAYPLLLKLAGADFGALAVSATSDTTGYEWSVAGLPPAFFADYAEMAPHDFVRAAVMARPNLVLRDAEMIERRGLEHNMMYHRAREVGAPLEHVMAVMLDVQPGLLSGIALYRDRRKPFTLEDTRALQEVTAALRNTVRNCHHALGAARKEQALEKLLEAKGIAALLMRLPSTELARTARAAEMMDRWFAGTERRGNGVPEPILNALAESTAKAGGPFGLPGTWGRSRDRHHLRVQFFEIPSCFRDRSWIVVLEELDEASALPPAWQTRLTTRESEVTACVLRGWDNQLVADELGCRIGTVKKHLERIFDKLGVASRAALLHQAATARRDALGSA